MEAGSVVEAGSPVSTGNPRSPKPHRLSREESQAQTRSRLIGVGREHFLRHGLGGVIAERIAEEAGYSRGALYSNFSGKEDLFLAVMRHEHQRYRAVFDRIAHEMVDSQQFLRALRGAFVDMLVDPDWVMLWAEFESEALRNPTLRECYQHLHEEMFQDAGERLNEHIQQGKLRLRMDPGNFIIALGSFSHGLATRQRLLGSRLPEATTRKLVGEMFDSLIQSPE